MERHKPLAFIFNSVFVHLGNVSSILTFLVAPWMKYLAPLYSPAHAWHLKHNVFIEEKKKPTDAGNKADERDETEP